MMFSKQIAALEADIGNEQARLRDAGITVPDHPLEGGGGGGMFAAKITAREIHLEKLKALGGPKAAATATAAVVRAPSRPAQAFTPGAQQPAPTATAPPTPTSTQSREAARPPLTLRQRFAANINLQLAKRASNHV